MAEHLATQPTYGLSLIKKAIHAAADNNLDEQLILERDLQRLAGRSSDYREGVQAFMQNAHHNIRAAKSAGDGFDSAQSCAIFPFSCRLATWSS